MTHSNSYTFLSMALLATGVPLAASAEEAIAGQPVAALHLADMRNEALILRDDFEKQGLDTADWNVNANSGASVTLTQGFMSLGTDPYPGAPAGSVTVNGTEAFSLNATKLIFMARVSAYRDHTLYGDYQPRGLAAGADRNNAIEFVSSLTNFPYGVACRTVKNGAVTETVVRIDKDVAVNNVYQIVATVHRVEFFINGQQVAVHTTNIPSQLPLNPFFSTQDGGAGNVPLTVDWVSFSRMPAL